MAIPRGAVGVAGPLVPTYTLANVAATEELHDAGAVIFNDGIPYRVIDNGQDANPRWAWHPSAEGEGASLPAGYPPTSRALEISMLQAFLRPWEILIESVESGVAWA